MSFVVLAVLDVLYSTYVYWGTDNRYVRCENHWQYNADTFLCLGDTTRECVEDDARTHDSRRYVRRERGHRDDRFVSARLVQVARAENSMPRGSILLLSRKRSRASDGFRAFSWTRGISFSRGYESRYGAFISVSRVYYVRRRWQYNRGEMYDRNSRC